MDLLIIVQPGYFKTIVLYIVAAFLNLQACSLSHIRVFRPTAVIFTSAALQSFASVKIVLVHLHEKNRAVQLQPESAYYGSVSFQKHKSFFSTFPASFHPSLWILSYFRKSFP